MGFRFKGTDSYKDRGAFKRRETGERMRVTKRKQDGTTDGKNTEKTTQLDWGAAAKGQAREEQTWKR